MSPTGLLFVRMIPCSRRAHDRRPVREQLRDGPRGGLVAHRGARTIPTQQRETEPRALEMPLSQGHEAVSSGSERVLPDWALPLLMLIFLPGFQHLRRRVGSLYGTEGHRFESCRARSSERVSSTAERCEPDAQVAQGEPVQVPRATTRHSLGLGSEEPGELPLEAQPGVLLDDALPDCVGYLVTA